MPTTPVDYSINGESRSHAGCIAVHHFPSSRKRLPLTRNTGRATDFAPIEQLQLMKFAGESWHLFGSVMSGQAEG